MNVSYRREMKHNYMIIDPEEISWRSYECQIMESNAIEGLLRLQARRNNGEMQFYYEITSRQPLERLLENRPISGEEIRRLVIGISNSLDQVERFLLDEGSILLKPEYIYVEPDTFRVWLCLVPGLKQDFPDAYGKLLEYILGKVNHQDKDSVVLAYGLYQETRKENYGIEDIMRLLQQNPAPVFSGNRYTESSGAVVDGRQIEQPAGNLKRNVVSDQESAENKGLWFRIKSFFTGHWGKKPDGEITSDQLSWQAMFLEEDGEASEMTESSAVATPAPPVSLPSSDFTPTGQGTVLLSDSSPKETLKKLKALDGGEEDIVLSYYPFVIGKQENLADYILNHETVSRLHLRIDRIGEDYQIMDLNSTNGTVVRGVMLENNQSVPLYPGDEVQIAKYRYRFG